MTRAGVYMALYEKFGMYTNRESLSILMIYFLSHKSYYIVRYGSLSPEKLRFSIFSYTFCDFLALATRWRWKPRNRVFTCRSSSGGGKEGGPL